ncbi:MAG TPA: alpha-1,4-glucan--maltose-1-phosphate maltosyltransferase [Candidatus Limnocylindrales bacterium]|nr:alpha-1,4-glucan--maltose-1-phosphate maltosyltransferase [Candidatus Limnocylindrales bacterium]
MTQIELDGRRRAVIENVTPRVDDGRFPVKRIVGDRMVVEADAFADGHDEVRVVLRWCGPAADDGEWHEVEMEPLGNDRWRASFALEHVGRYEYSIAAWVDRFRTWQHDLAKRVEAGQDVTVDLQIGAAMVEEAAARAEGDDADHLKAAAQHLTAARGLNAHLLEVVERHPDRAHETTLDRPLTVTVDPVRAGFSAWYELFPRSASPDPKRHGTFDDVIARLPYVQELGFDVLYLPPIHPIGRQFRKGPNNRPSETAYDPGVPWAIGASVGGHTAVHPELGDLAGFDRLVAAARQRGIQVALDIAFQASPDHPWVAEHPEWFRARPDGTIQYAENPPKKYQDIYPFDFESRDWRGLWDALADVFRFWIGRGVTIFRVDNPHTKAFAFWEWAINDIKRDHPETIFLAEAFTRPKPMYRLAKLGFSQSYTYFTWRNSAAEMREYFEELTKAPIKDFFRPNAWPNTPDILHADLQKGGRAAFEARFVLAATLSANYGIYGPAFELGESTPRESDSEEYLDSEKYQQRTWDLERPDSLRELITRVNRARKSHPALQTNERLWFHPTGNRNLLAYTKNSEDRADVILTVVNFDFKAGQSGVLELDLAGLGLPVDRPFQVVDLLDDTRIRWQGPRIPVELDPRARSAYVLWLKP